MGEFLITAPDGKKYKVTGDNKEGALAALKKMLGVQPVASDNSTAMADRIAAAKAGTLQVSPERAAQQAEIDQNTQDQITLSRPQSALAALDTFNQGLPFVGAYADELAGAVGRGMEAVGLADKGAGDRATAAMRESNAAYERQNPKTATALQIGGGVVGSIPMAAVALPGAIAAAPAALAGRIVGGAVLGASTGALEGAVSGYGRGVGDTRMKSAGDGALMGGAFGGIAGGAAPAIGAGFKAIVERIKGRDISTIARTLGISDDAARSVKSAIENDDMAAAQAALAKAGPDAMLADAGAGGARMLDTATKSSGAAARIARDAIEPRVAAVRTKMDAILDTVLGPYEGIKANAKGIASRTSAVRKTAYDRAYASPIDYSTGGKGEAVLGVLERIPPKTLNTAISEANDAMRAAGVTNRQIMAEIGADGAVTFREMPNVQQLDEIKKALGSIAQKEVDQFGRPTSAGLRAQKLAGSLRDAVGDAVGPYKLATRLGGDKIAEDNALALGKDLLTQRATRETVGDFVAGQPSKEALAAAKKGLRTFIDDTLANVRRTMADPNTDAGEAMKLIKDMSSRANREKVTAVLGKAGSDRVYAVIDEAAAAMNVRGAISRNSDTFGRQAMDRTVRDIVEVGPIGYLKQGKPGEAGKRLVQILTGATKEADQARMQAIYADIAKALTTIRGQAAKDAITTIEAAIAGQPMKSAQAAQIANVLATGSALSGYQLGTRSQSTP